MADFIEIMNIRKKMCQSVEMCSEECPLFVFTLNNNVTGYQPCSDRIMNHPEDAEKIIMQWNEKHK